MSQYIAQFHYDRRGYGHLIIGNDSDIVSILCRTGSIGADGELKNAIPPGKWTGRDFPAYTDEAAMTVDGFGWKYRLWDDKGNRTHYLIHPDGNLPGSLGCIVMVKRISFKWLCQLFKSIYDKQEILPVTITCDERKK